MNDEDKRQLYTYFQAIEESEDYRATYAQLDDIDTFFDSIENELEMDTLAEWVCIDHSNWSCTFMNRAGEVRVIGAQYIDSCFEGE